MYSNYATMQLYNWIVKNKTLLNLLWTDQKCEMVKSIFEQALEGFDTIKTNNIIRNDLWKGILP